MWIIRSLDEQTRFTWWQNCEQTRATKWGYYVCRLIRLLGSIVGILVNYVEVVGSLGDPCA